MVTEQNSKHLCRCLPRHNTFTALSQPLSKMGSLTTAHYSLFFRVSGLINILHVEVDLSVVSYLVNFYSDLLSAL